MVLSISIRGVIWDIVHKPKLKRWMSQLYCSLSLSCGVCQYYSAFYLTATQRDPPLEAVEMHLLTFPIYWVLTDYTDGSMFGKACASKAISTAAMDWVRRDV